ncbi:hypothetical protein PVK06_028254 [Gossypium arboreum]|uniref:Uncharacterized protein n=1 Tax=Gossypium arboreum TaxID=29729 RepID=A0ABR0P2X4_GOSAR|nr:hypothetical protein PVK06_028254 [Gossypium arboreum]
MKETLEMVMGRIEDLSSIREGFKDFMWETLRSTSNKLTVRDHALEAMVTTMKEEIVELKEELTIYKAALGSGMLTLGPKQHKMDVLKPDKFKRARSVREVDNFLWGLDF